MIRFRSLLIYVIVQIIIESFSQDIKPTTFRPRLYRPITNRPTIARYNNQGRYNAGRYKEGQYVSSNAGKYASDGRYVPDNLGKYEHSDVGYQHNKDLIDPYKHQKDKIDPYKHNDDSGKYVHMDPGYTHTKDFIDPYKHQKDESPPYIHQKDQDQYKKPAEHVIGTVTGNYAPITAATLPTFTLKKVSEDVSKLYDANYNHSIIFDMREIRPEAYNYTYKITNTIFAAENGNLINGNDGNETLETNGFYEYVGPDAVLYRVDYTSGDNGFQPQALHLPTAPPTPEYILKMLEWQRANGFLKDDE